MLGYHLATNSWDRSVAAAILRIATFRLECGDVCEFSVLSTRILKFSFFNPNARVQHRKLILIQVVVQPKEVFRLTEY